VVDPSDERLRSWREAGRGLTVQEDSEHKGDPVGKDDADHPTERGVEFLLYAVKAIIGLALRDAIRPSSDPSRLSTCS
jgi:hypothetical protein